MKRFPRMKCRLQNKIGETQASRSLHSPAQEQAGGPWGLERERNPQPRRTQSTKEGQSTEDGQRAVALDALYFWLSKEQPGLIYIHFNEP